MRRIRERAVIVTALATVLAACSDVQPVAPVLPAAGGAAVDRLVAMGFDRASIVDQGDAFVVEGDMRFPKAALAGPRMDVAPAGPRAQYHTTTLVSQSKMASGITVNLSAISSNAGWTQAVRSAMQVWRGTYGNTIWITETTGTADVNVSFSTSIGSAVAQGNMPINGQMGNTLLINSSYANSLTSSQKQFVIVHELGHIVGFRHTNWYGNNEGQSAYGAVWIPGTPDSATAESGSVMTANTASRSWSSFTNYDVVAMNSMYPAPSPVVSASYDASSHPYLQWNAISNAASYRVTAQYIGYTYVCDQVNGCTWDTDWLSANVGETTSTSMSATGWTRSYDASCELQFYVEPIYPSGKVGKASLMTQVFDAC